MNRFQVRKYFYKIFFSIITIIILSNTVLLYSNFNSLTNLSANTINLSGSSHQLNTPIENLTNRFIYSQSTSLRSSVGVSPLLDQGFNGTGIKIGIVDTGVYASHVEFGGRIINQSSFVSTVNGYSGNISSTADTYGHGTMIAGLAIGTTVGMAPAAQLVSAKIYDASVTGNAGFGGNIEEETSRAVAAAIEWLVTQNVSIISLSLGQYQDIFGEGRAWIIDKVTAKDGIIFTVAAGNEGVAGINTGSIGNPAESLQAITIGMSDGTTAVDLDTSYGPRYDWTMKPDVVAPGVFLNSSSNNGGYNSCTGTSCATPVVAGAVADILSALKMHNVTYTPGTIKAALLATAQPIQDSSTGTAYPWWVQGAGLINADNALKYILSASRTNITLPDLLTTYPNHLPFTPIQTLFQGQQLGFNVTLVSSGLTAMTISLENLSSAFVSIPTHLLVSNTGLLPVWFHIPLNVCDGLYTGTIVITTNRNALKTYINIHFDLHTPKQRILFDEAHNGLYNQVINLNDNINIIQDPWGKSTFLLGSYFTFFLQMITNNISVSTFRSGSLDNLSYLQQFDTLMLVYPETKLTDPFSDWWNDYTYFPESNLSNNVISFSSQELQTISDFAYKLNHNVLIFTAYPGMENVTALNSLLNVFNISYTDTLVKQTINSVDFPEPLNTSVSSIDFIGSSLVANTSTFTGKLFGRFTNTTGAFAYWKGNAGGEVLISGSGYFIDNFGLSTLATRNAKNNYNFLMNILNNLSKNAVPLSYPIDCSLSSSDSIVEIIFLTMTTGILIITSTIIAVITRRSRVGKKF